MADNVPFTPGTGRNMATDQVTYSGDTADVQLIRPVDVTGAEGSRVVVAVPLATSTLQGALTETAPGTDTASSGLNGRLQRIAQRLTSLIALLPTALGGSGGLKVEIVAGAGSGTAQVDEAAFTLATTSFTPIGGVYNSTPDTLASGKTGALQMTAARGMHAHLVDAAGVPISAAATAITDSITAKLASDKIIVSVAGVLTELTPKWAIINATLSGNNSIVASVAGKKIRVIAYDFVCLAAVVVKWQSATTDITGPQSFDPKFGKVNGFNPLGWFETASTVALNLNLSLATTVGGVVCYVEVP